MTTSVDPVLNITIGDELRSFFMSYGLLLRGVKAIGDADVSAVFVDPNVQERVVKTILAGKDGNMEDIDLDDFAPEVIEEIVQWAGTHILGFTMRGLAATARAGQHFSQELQEITSTPGSTGSKS